MKIATIRNVIFSLSSVTVLGACFVQVHEHKSQEEAHIVYDISFHMINNEHIIYDIFQVSMVQRVLLFLIPFSRFAQDGVVIRFA